MVTNIIFLVLTLIMYNLHVQGSRGVLIVKNHLGMFITHVHCISSTVGTIVVVVCYSVKFAQVMNDFLHHNLYILRGIHCVNIVPTLSHSY